MNYDLLSNFVMGLVISSWVILGVFWGTVLINKRMTKVTDGISKENQA